MSEKYEIGTMRQLFGLGLMERIRQAMDECKNLKEPYYIYFFNQSNISDHTIHRTRVIAMRKDQLKKVIPYVNGRPVAMLGTGLIKVDNRQGKAEWVWMLPRDIPQTQALDPYDQVITEIAEQAWRMNAPIINA